MFVDFTGGYGRGVVDRLHERGYDVVTGVNFGAAAIDEVGRASWRERVGGAG